MEKCTEKRMNDETKDGTTAGMMENRDRSRNIMEKKKQGESNHGMTGNLHTMYLQADADEMTGKLIEAATEAMGRAYTPYSHFQVGAALLTGTGRIYLGCNIENAAYTPTNCAERTAFFKAVSEGEREFEAICIIGGKNGVANGVTAPCGVCRQVMREFCDPKTFRIILPDGADSYQEFLLEELLPLGFGPENLLG